MLWRVVLWWMYGLGRLNEGYLIGENAIDVGTDGCWLELVYVAGTGED